MPNNNAPEQAKRPVLHEPNITLNELAGMFKESASDEMLDNASRRFAARLCVLTRHVQIVNSRQVLIAQAHDTLERRVTALDEQLAKLIELLQPIFAKAQGASESAAGQATGERDAGEAGEQSGQTAGPGQGDGEEDAARVEALARQGSGGADRPPPSAPARPAAPGGRRQARLSGAGGAS